MRTDSSKLAFQLFLFGFLFAFFQIMPSFLKKMVWGPFSSGEVLDFLTPLVVIFCVYLIYVGIKHIQSGDLHYRGRRMFGKIILGLGCLLYVQGHGLHLASNAIANLLQHEPGSELYEAVYLLDEIISHLIWDGGVFLISVGLLLWSYKIPHQILFPIHSVLVVLGAVLFGFTFCVNAIEGQTIIISLPAAGLGFLLAMSQYRQAKRAGEQNPVSLFFWVAYLLCLILLLYWGLRYSGFPQFSELGWI